MALGHGPEITTEGLILYLDSGNSISYPGSGSAWNDITDNRLSASAVQSPAFSSSNIGYFSFDGGSITTIGQVDSFSISDNSVLDNMSEISIEMWLYITSSNASPNLLFSKRSTTSDGYVGFFSNSGFTFRFGTSIGTQLTWTTTPATLAWQHLVITVGASGGKVFQNGQEVHSDNTYTGNFGNINTASNLLIGDVNPTSSGIYGFNGRLSIFKIYNKILSAENILQNYVSIKGRYGL